MNAAAATNLPLWDHSLNTVSADPDWIAEFGEAALIDPRVLGERWAAGEIKPRRVSYEFKADGVAVLNINTFISKRFSAYSCYAGFDAAIDIAQAIDELNRDASVRAIILALRDVPGTTIAGVDRMLRAIERVRDDVLICSHVDSACLGGSLSVFCSAHQAHAHPRAKMGCARAAQTATGWLSRSGTDCVDTWEPDEHESEIKQAFDDWVCNTIIEHRPSVDRDVLESNEIMNAERAQSAGLIDDIITIDALVERIRCQLEYTDSP